MITTSILAKRVRLAAAIERDILDRNARPTHHSPTCLGCGRSYKGRDDRFCSPTCRAGFDLGLPAYAPADLERCYGLPKGPHGFWIQCAHCRRRFDSRGLRCCSAECDRDLRLKREIDAELADDPFRVIKRKCECCGGPIPNWRKGRKVSTATKFCSSRCRDRHRRNANLAPDSPQADLPRETARKWPETGASRSGSRKGSPPSGAWISGTAGGEMPA
jgi:hypothetical protein